jgi:hypothetical protein
VLLSYADIVESIKKKQMLRQFFLLLEVLKNMVALLRLIDGQSDQVIDETLHAAGAAGSLHAYGC